MSNEQSEVTQANAIDTQKIIDELALNSCSLNANAEDFVKHIRTSSEYITQIISNLEKCVKHQDEVLVKMSSELRMLVLIPEKMQTRINEVVPQIATEVEKIYSSKLELLEQKSESIEDKIAKSVTNHDEKITETTNNAITLLKDKIEQFTTSLMKDANLTSSDNRASFFKQLAIMVY